MRDIKTILEGIVSQAKPMGSGSAAFRHSSSSGAKGPEHGIDVGAHRNYDHEVRAKNKSLDDAKKREQTVEKRNREAEQRQKETAKMAKEETVTEAKHVFHVHMKSDDMRSHKMVDDKTSEPVGAKPKRAKLVLKVPAADSREARNKVSKHIQKNYGVSAVKSIEYKGLDEEVVNEAKKFVFDKPQSHMVKAYDKRDTSELHDMHKRWSADHSKPKNNPETSEKLLAVHHVLKSRGENVGELPKHKNLGLTMHEETNTEKRMAIKNVARPNDAAPTSEKSTLAKTGEIKTKIVEEKPTMSMPNFGLSQSLINAARQIAEKKQEDDGVDAKKMTGGKTVVDTDPETNDKVEDADSKPAKKKSHTVPKTDKEKKLAALASPKDKITHKDVMVGRGVVRKEEVELSAEEIERIEAIAAQLDEAKPTIVSSPIRGANQDQSGFGTKGSTADYTISDSKKMKEELSSKEKMKRGMYNKEEVELDEAVYKVNGPTNPRVGYHVVDKQNKIAAWGYKTHDAATAQAKKMEAELKAKRKALKAPVKEEVELEEGRGRPRKNPLPAGQETEGDDTHKHPMQQLEKIAHSVEGNEPHFEHKDGSKTKVGKNLARHMVVTHNSMKTTQEKNSFADKLHANRDSMRSEMGKHF